MNISSDFEIVVGLEIHIQLNTKTKLFSADTTSFGAEPNTQTNEVSLAHPGTLPVLNEAAIAKAIKLGVAFNCEISQNCYFDRKHYFYPDSPLGYQITQQNTPICLGGLVSIPGKKGEKFIELEKIHMEADAGKSIHDLDDRYSMIDLNRAGMPLLELVSKPVLHSIDDVGNFVNEVQQTVRFLGISDGNMEEGSLRCDANISVRKVGEKLLGAKVEIKNMNSVRYIKRALKYEFTRQCNLILEGGSVKTESRLFNVESGETAEMRTKEEAHDYRYFPDPDLAPILISDEQLSAIANNMPVLPAALRRRFLDDYQLSPADALILSHDQVMSKLLLDAIGRGSDPKETSKWILGPVKGLYNQLDSDKFLLSGEQLAKLLGLISTGKLTYKNGVEEVLPKLIDKSTLDPAQVVAELGLAAQDSGDELAAIIQKIVEDHPNEVAAYRSGKKAILQLFMGKVMKETRGKANPKKIMELLQNLLKS